ncbi:MAG TPA: hypothetical protein VJC18_11525, partial [bacterium]|nr:hypothetical protein [bacterium]
MLSIVFSIYFLIPTVIGLKDLRATFEKEGKALPWYYQLLPNQEMNLGLDLRGGAYVEMEVSLEDALKQELNGYVNGINRAVLDDYNQDADKTENKNPVYQGVLLQNNRIRVEYPADKKDEVLSGLVGYLGNQAFTFGNDRYELFLNIVSNAAQARKIAFEATKGLPDYQGDVLFVGQEKYLAVSFNSQEQKQKLIELFSLEQYQTDFTLADQTTVSVAYLTPSDKFLAGKRKDIIDQAANSVRNRIDRFGVAEASVSRQSSDRLVVELPGVKDPEQVINIIKRTGKLEFRIVDSSLTQPDLEDLVQKKREELKLKNIYEDEALAQVNQALKGSLPPHTEILFELKRDPVTKKISNAVPYLLEDKADVTGDMLDSTSVQTENNMPYVLMTFNNTGTKNFGKLTTDNVGKQLAIVLDNVVTSSPVIRGPITAGRAQIELGIGPYNDLLKEAQDIVMILKEGALP